MDSLRVIDPFRDIQGTQAACAFFPGCETHYRRHDPIAAPRPRADVQS
ncbi:MAG: hypothetical protein J4F40_11920 [Alphaproteobacteria bacterium]|nr:hypothetical protein [Alphaproteobacteria bacterium]